MASVHANPRAMCHCLGVTEQEIESAALQQGCEELQHVIAATEAGTGCTACHHRICDLLGRIRRAYPAAAGPPA